MKLIKKFAIAAVSATVFLGAMVPAEAMPLPAAPAAQVSNSDVTNIQYREYRRGGYYGGYRGDRGYRRGYRHHNGAWVPLAAFGAGALIGGAIASQRYVEPAPTRVYSGASGINPRHYEYCSARYRSYDAYSNSFQPYNGPRQTCTSPYY